MNVINQIYVTILLFSMQNILSMNHTTDAVTPSGTSSSSHSDGSASGVVVAAGSNQTERDRVCIEIDRIGCSASSVEERSRQIRILLLQMNAPVTVLMLRESLRFLDSETLNNLLNKLSPQQKLKILNKSFRSWVKHNLLMQGIINLSTYNLSQFKLISTLLEHGADPNQPNLVDELFLWTNNPIERIRIFDLLVAYGLKLEAQNRSCRISRETTILDQLVATSQRQVIDNNQRNILRVIIARTRQLIAAMPAMRTAQMQAIADRRKAIYDDLEATIVNILGLPKELFEIINNYDIIQIPLPLPDYSPEVVNVIREAGFSDLLVERAATLASGSNNTSTRTNASSTSTNPAVILVTAPAPTGTAATAHLARAS